AKRTLNPIPPAANPCCNPTLKIGVVLSLQGGRCDGAPEQAANRLRRDATGRKPLGAVQLRSRGFVASWTKRENNRPQLLTFSNLLVARLSISRWYSIPWLSRRRRSVRHSMRRFTFGIKISR